MTVTIILSLACIAMVAGPGEEENPPTPTVDAKERGDVWPPLPVHTVVTAPEWNLNYPGVLYNAGDLQGDGVDDLLMQSMYVPHPLENSWDSMAGGGLSVNRTILMLGRTDRIINYSDNPEMVYGRDTVPAGDLNGDGKCDAISRVMRTWEPVEPNVEVRYGYSGGLLSSPDRILDCKAKSAASDRTPCLLIYGPGDLNGDSYDDIVVLSGEMSADSKTSTPLELQLFFGSADGPPNTPSTRLEIRKERRQYWSGLRGLSSGDVNADGFTDLIMAFVQGEGSPSLVSHELAVHYGSSAGLTLEPQQLISMDIGPGYRLRLHSPIKIDADGYHDIAVDVFQYCPTWERFDTTFVGPYNHTVLLYKGSAGGLSTASSQRLDLTGFLAPFMEFADIDGDGRSDLIHLEFDFRHIAHIPNLPEPPPHYAYSVGVHPNVNGSIDIEARWKNNIGTYTNPADSMTVADIDADGKPDVILGVRGSFEGHTANGPEYYLGRIIILWGDGITSVGAPCALMNDTPLFAGLGPYDFWVNGNAFIDRTVDKVTLVLDPSGTSIHLDWVSIQAGGNGFVPYDGPYLSMCSTVEDIVDRRSQPFLFLRFRIVPGWDWPHEDACDVSVEFTLSNGTVRTFHQEDVFSVENDLDLVGPFSVTAERQGSLQEGGWVGARELLTVSGPRVVYEGTTDVYPPSGTCNVVLHDDDGDFVSAPQLSGADVSLALRADASTDLDENLTLTLQDLPGTARAVHSPQFHLRVDGDLPRLRDPMPGPDEWASYNPVVLAITVDDGAGAGVDASTLEYQFSVGGPGHYGLWTRLLLETDPDGPVVGGMVTMELPDADDYYIRWRARDLVNMNYAVSGDCRVMVDTFNVTFSGPVPSPDEWQTALEVLVGVTITDGDGAGVDVSEVYYRVSAHNLTAYGAWTKWEPGSWPDFSPVEPRANAQLAETPYNSVQWRARDVAGNGPAVSPHYRVKVDATPVEFLDFRPSGIQNSSTVECTILVRDPGRGSGVMPESVEYRYRTGNMDFTEWLQPSVELAGGSVLVTMRLEGLTQGATNPVELRALDVAGNGPAVSERYALTVDTVGPEFLSVLPPSGERQPEPAVAMTIVVRDALAGMEITAARYRYGTAGPDSLGEWMRLPMERAEDGNLTGTVLVDLARGMSSYVQFMCTDRVGNARLSDVVYVPVNLLPHAVLRFPLDGSEVSHEKDVRLSAEGSSDPEGDALNYTWYVDGRSEPLTTGVEARARLSAGTHNITLVVTDAMGGEDRRTVTVYVMGPPRVRWYEGSGGAAWLIVLIVTLVLVVWTMAKRHIQRVKERDGARAPGMPKRP